MKKAKVAQADVDERLSQGADPSEIRHAKWLMEREQQVEKLCADIHRAFAKVRLGEGIGLFEGQALDDYAPPE